MINYIKNLKIFNIFYIHNFFYFIQNLYLLFIYFLIFFFNLNLKYLFLWYIINTFSKINKIISHSNQFCSFILLITICFLRYLFSFTYSYTLNHPLLFSNDHKVWMEHQGFYILDYQLLFLVVQSEHFFFNLVFF